MSRISKATIQEVNNRLDAVAVVSEYVHLEQRGGRWWGRCPFHGGGQEKTPSFKVDPDQKLYYCFGCQKGGSVLNFVMEMDKSGFSETVKNLARKCGVEIVYEDGGGEGEWDADNSRKEQLHELYRRTAGTFHHFLLEKSDGRAALDYLLSRKISREMIERFNVGYSPGDRHFLYRFLQKKGYSPDFLDVSGLFSDQYRGSAFFSNRLMFPIADRQGKVIAFGGRALPGAAQADGREPPKYINSRETEIYKKGQNLFALHLALPEIRQSKTVYIAEGYMDVIALHQAGVANAVAPLGTAFTDEQAKLLRRWAEKAVLVFDSDAAGQNAAFKGIITCRKNGLSCALTLPGTAEGANLKDPADILQKFGPETLNYSMKCVIIDFEYIVARGRTLYDVSVPEGKTKALALLFPYLEALGSEVERDDCIGAAADAFGVDREAVRRDYQRRPAGRAGQAKREEVSAHQADVFAAGQLRGAAAREQLPVRMNDELFLLTVVSVNADLYPEFRAALEMREIEDPAAKELFVALEECFIHEESGVDALLSRVSSVSLRKFVVERGTSSEFRGSEKYAPRKLMEDGINRVKEKKLRRRLVEIGAELRMRERNPNSNGADGGLANLIAEKMEIDAEIRKLEGK